MRPIQIVNSTEEDLPDILSFYEAAIAYQKEKSEQHWLPFAPELIRTEIRAKQQ